MARRHLAVVVVAVVVAATGCGGGSAAEEAEDAENTTTTTIDVRYEGVLFDAAGPIQELVSELGPPVQIVAASLSTDTVTVQVRQATDPTKVDAYTYSAGQWGDPRPVQLDVEGIGALDSRTYFPEDVNWSAVAAAGPKALELFAQDLEEPRLDGAGFRKRETGVVAVFTVTGLRGKGDVEVDASTGVITRSARS